MRHPMFRLGESAIIWEGDNFANATEYDGARCNIIGEVKNGVCAGQIVVWGVTLGGEVFIESFYPCKVIPTRKKKILAEFEQYLINCADEEAYRGVD